MTNKEFIKRLRKAKELALAQRRTYNPIARGCLQAGIRWVIDANATFGAGTKWAGSSYNWTLEVGASAENIARVFDESIKALGGKP